MIAEADKLITGDFKEAWRGKGSTTLSGDRTIRIRYVYEYHQPGNPGCLAKTSKPLLGLDWTGLDFARCRQLDLNPRDLRKLESLVLT